MQYLILGLGVVIGCAMLLQWAATADPRSLASALKAMGLLAIGGLGLVLLLTGQLGLALMLAPILLPLLLNWRAISNRMRAARGPTPGQTSHLQTAYLHVVLDHDTGDVHGTVLQGRFAGRELADLSVVEMHSLLEECRIDDPQSAAVVEAYLDRVYGTDWRGAGEDSHDRGPSGAPGGGRMTTEEAYRILGLSPGASTAEIKAAHRRLMKQYHPDQGGTNYLAAKVNEAKDVLLGS